MTKDEQIEELLKENAMLKEALYGKVKVYESDRTGYIVPVPSTSCPTEVKEIVVCQL